MFQYPVLNCRVIDGDSAELDIDLGFHISRRIKARLVNIDAPERGTQASREVTAVVQAWVNKAEGLLWRSSELDKYGRSLGGLRCKNFTLDLTTYLLTNKLVRRYSGERRSPWSETELEAIVANAKLCQEAIVSY